MKYCHISHPSFLGNATAFPVKRYFTNLVSQRFFSPFWSAEISVPGWVKPANYSANWNFPLWLTEEFSLQVGGKNMDFDHTVWRNNLKFKGVSILFFFLRSVRRTTDKTLKRILILICYMMTFTGKSSRIHIIRPLNSYYQPRCDDSYVTSTNAFIVYCSNQDILYTGIALQTSTIP